ncbi:MAG: TIGR01777 family oxidoreductase [Fimbriimonadales bacterium]
MKVVMSGASGLIGAALAEALASDGHEVVPLVRRQAGPGEARWDPENGYVDLEGVRGVHAAVHLAGENVVGRWTAAKKQRILRSRQQGTRTLAEALTGLDPRPRVLLSASGVNYYGDRGDEVLTEKSAPGEGFLAGVCREWEAATAPATSAGIRVANLRLGVVLSGKGGAIAKMRLPFGLGLGGRIGSGRQWMSWIALDDAVAAFRHALSADTLSGPVNTTSPNPVTNAEFTRTLARALRRPTFLAVPAFALRIAFGQMADESLLSSVRAVPLSLLESGFQFRYPSLDAALRHVL